MVDCSTFTSSPFADGGNATQFLDSALCTYQMGYGMILPAVVVWFTVISMVYIRTQSVVMPIVLTLLMGAAVLTQLPATGVQIAAILLIGGGSMLFIILLRRLDL